MMHPMVRMLYIGIICGVGLCNLLWMAVAFHPVSLVVATLLTVCLALIYLDHQRYYREARS